MTKILVLAAAFAFAIVSSTSFAQERPKSYDPSKGVPPTAAAPTKETVTTDVMKKQREAAQQRFAAWTEAKIACYKSAGLNQAAGDFRVNPNDPTKLQIRDNVWLQPSKYNLDKLETCR